MSPHEVNPVATGIDVLARDGFAALRGRRVGLITNHTGLTRDGRAITPLLHTSGISLVALFSPEHGLHGVKDEGVLDSREVTTGLPVYSLYGTRTRPTSEQLAGIDTLVYDIQDVGVRFYTYSSTLGYCLEEAARHGLRYVVLDRPNPLGGLEIEGPLADTNLLSFVAYHPVPIRHSLTFGELAHLYNAEKRLNADLQVIQMEGWRRAALWDDTNLTWVNPSPNMRSLTEAFLYPGIGLLETTNVSVGRGTDTPFEVVGAPWLEGRELAAVLNARRLPGVRFVPIRFTPVSSIHAGHACGGINIVIVDRAHFVPVLTGLSIAEALHRLYPQAWDTARFNNLLANRAAFDAFLAGAGAETLVHSWQPEIRQFRNRIHAHLLYA